MTPHQAQAELLHTFRALTHLAATLNSRQHAGLPITPVMWSELYRVTNKASAILANAEAPVS